MGAFLEACWNALAPGRMDSPDLVKQFREVGLRQIIASTDPADVAYDPRSGHLYIADSEIEELSQFAGVNIFETSLDGKTLYRSYATNNSEPTGVSFNTFVRLMSAAHALGSSFDLISNTCL